MASENPKIPVWFWVVVGLLLVWNILGLVSFFYHVTLSDEALMAFSENERELMGRYPLWTKIAFAFATFGGFFGCVALLLKKAWAKPILIVSLAAILLQMGHSIFIAKSAEVLGPGSLVMPIMIIVVGAFLVWLADLSIKKGWLT